MSGQEMSTFVRKMTHSIISLHDADTRGQRRSRKKKVYGTISTISIPISYISMNLVCNSKKTADAIACVVSVQFKCNHNKIVLT